MTRYQLIRKLRKLARQQNVDFDVDKKHGKGSHCTLEYDGKKSTCPAGELMTGTLKQILDTLGIDPDDLP